MESQDERHKHDVSGVVLHVTKAVCLEFWVELWSYYTREIDKLKTQTLKWFGGWTRSMRDFGLCNVEKRMERKDLIVCLFFSPT